MSADGPRSSGRLGAVVVALLGLFTALALFTGGARGPTPLAASPSSSPSASGAPSAHPPHEHPPERGPAPPGAIALLGGLDVGSEIEGWAVDRVAVRSQEVQISFDRKGSGFEIRVSRRGVSKFLPPIETEKYAVFFGFLREYGEPVPREVPGKVATDIAGRIRRSEGGVAVPPGL